MKLFLLRIFGFFFLVICLLLAGIFSPTTPRSKKSLLFSHIRKDSLLKFQESPRIIFVGGSNVAFGINSQMVKDSLGYNPINTGVNILMGIKYMLEHTLENVKENDIVVFLPEYHLYYTTYDDMSEPLMRTIFDVDISKFGYLSSKQIAKLLKLLPKYALSKLKPSEYFTFLYKEDNINSVNAYNQYGDINLHLKKQKLKFDPYTFNSDSYNPEIIERIKAFETTLKKKKVMLFISYPTFQDISFNLCLKQISNIQEELKKGDFNIIGTPEQFCFPDSMMFNTAYHVGQKARDFRTQIIIEGIRPFLK